MSLFENDVVCPTDVLRLSSLIPNFYFDPEDNTTDKFVEIFEGVFCQWINDITNLGKIIDVDVTDERFLNMLIRNLGFDLKVYLTVDKKRKLVKVIINAYKQKGTCVGIENVIRQFVGIDVTCFPFTTGWILDISELGFDTYLNPSPDNPAGFYTFDVLVDTVLSQEQERIILDLIELMKPAHTHFRQLVQTGVDNFAISVLKMINRGSLYLRNNQNNDGGWDANESDLSPLNASDVQNVSYHGLGLYFAYLFNTDLEVVQTGFLEASAKVVADGSFSFSTSRPRESDIFLLNRAASNGVVGAAAKRDEAIFAFKEWLKAMAYLNNYAATSVQLAATSQPERDTSTYAKQAKFLYLYLTNNYAVGEGIYRYARYIRDFIEVSDVLFAQALALELNQRTAGIPFSSGFGTLKIKALGSIVWALQQYNIGLVYETRISSALDELELLYNSSSKLYYSTSEGTGRLIEQTIVLDALMARAQYDRSKSLMLGIQSRQNVAGWIDDVLTPTSKRLRDLGTAMDSVGRAIKKITDEGL
ncbi:hypothetical protein MASR1M48_16250 [Lactococcus petauri]